MRIRYKSSLDDKAAFELYVYSHAPALRSKLEKTHSKVKWAFLFGAVLVVGNLALLAYIFNSALAFYAGFALLIAVVTAVCKSNGGFSPNVDKMKKMHKELRMEGAPCVDEIEHDMEIADYGIRDITDFYEDRVFWKAVDKVVVANNHVFICTVLGGSIIIPKGSLFEGDIDAFLNELRKRVDKWERTE